MSIKHLLLDFSDHRADEVILMSVKKKLQRDNNSLLYMNLKIQHCKAKKKIHGRCFIYLKYCPYVVARDADLPL